VIVSYAQNAEDVVLCRLLVGDRGTYVDVGAGHPSEDSTTKLFYDRGWSGINIEPHPEIYAALDQCRTRDTNVPCAIGNFSGYADLYIYQDRWGWSTIAEQVAAKHRKRGMCSTKLSVQVRPLNEVLLQLNPRKIDLLNIDVEGSEASVLQSIDLRRWNPRVIVVEATVPGEPTPSHEAWEDIVLTQEYALTLFDGLNRFYVRANDREAIDMLSVPANVFDNYIPNRWLRLMDPQIRNKLVAHQGWRWR
jgi:FkbM family methyltransferase